MQNALHVANRRIDSHFFINALLNTKNCIVASNRESSRELAI